MMFLVCSFGIWAGTSMSFSDGRKSPPHQANNAFTHGCAFEHNVTQAHPLLCIDSPNGRTFYPCDTK
jgi:hypothetical protein